MDNLWLVLSPYVGLVALFIAIGVAGAWQPPLWVWGHHYRELEHRCERLRRIADHGIAATEVAAEALDRRSPAPIHFEDRRYLVALRRKMVLSLSDGELRTIAFDVGADYDNLDGENKADKARELVACLARQKQIPALLEALENLRGDVDWRGSVT